MTESEFREFLITIGYRYNSKSQTAFNSYEGFHTMIEFNSKEKRYLLSLNSAASDIGAVSGKLKSFAAENKSFITKAVYKNKKIILSVKMTVDSEIDRENLKSVAKFIMELCKSDLLTPICGVCSRNKKTGLYVVGRNLMPICDRCIVRKRRQYAKRRDMFEKKKQNMPAGIAGAIFGAFLGASIYILLYQFISLYGIFGGVIVLLCFAGFVVTGKRATRLSAVICGIISFLVFLAAEYAALIAGTAILIENEGGGIAVTEAIQITNASFADFGYLRSIIIELAVGTAVMIIIGIIYFLKRKYTRPLTISKNIL